MSEEPVPMTRALAGDALAAPFTRLDDDAMADLARVGWGLAPRRVHRLATERDDTVVIDHGRGRHVLKVAHPLDDPGVLDLQCSALAHASLRDPGLPLAVLQPDVDGAVLRVVTGAAGEARRARLLTYLPGSPLDYATTGPEQRRAVGRVVGRLSLALSDFEHPAAARALPWDLQQVGRLSPLLAHVQDTDVRGLVASGLEDFHARVGPALVATRQQVVHNDANADNVLVDPHAAGFVTGLLDFGDIVRSSVVGDLAVAMAYAVGADGSLGPEQADPWGAAYDVASGYREERELTEDERLLLPSLVRLRLVQRLLVNSWLAACDPANAHYTARSVSRSGHALRLLVSTPSPFERGEA